MKEKMLARKIARELKEGILTCDAAYFLSNAGIKPDEKFLEAVNEVDESTLEAFLRVVIKHAKSCANN